MKELTLEEIKKSELDTIKIFHAFCEKNNLTYYITFGTLIGAVRHKGFIPWDDDVDVFMPIEDYESLVNNFNNESIGGRKVIDERNCKDYYLDYAKIIDCNTVLIEDGESAKIGVWIDIFPLEYVTDNEKLLQRERRWLKFIYSWKVYYNSECRKELGWIKNTILRLIHVISPSNEWFEKKQRKHKDKIRTKDKTKTYGMFSKNFDIYCVPYFPTAMFDPPILLEFEGEKLYAPREYEELLELMYGDYNQLPPINMRQSKHNYLCYWNEEV